MKRYITSPVCENECWLDRMRCLCQEEAMSAACVSVDWIKNVMGTEVRVNEQLRERKSLVE